MFRYSLLKLHHLHVIVTELKHQLINEELAVTNYKISNLKKDNTKLASKVKSLFILEDKTSHSSLFTSNITNLYLLFCIEGKILGV